MAIGIDIGGTGMRAALVNSDGKLLTKFIDQIRNEDTFAHVVDVVKELEKKAQDLEKEIVAIGIGLAGTIDPRTEILVSSATMLLMEGRNFRKEIEELTGYKTVVNNDANSAGYAEWKLGAGKGSQDCVSLFVGTGVGGALILNGQLYKGTDGVAGEIGHLILNPEGPLCPCGGNGCLEQLASGTAIEREILQKLSEKEPSSLSQKYISGQSITGKDIAAAAKAGDVIALEAYKNASTWLGVGIATIVNLLNVEVVVIGGGVMAASALLMPTITKVVNSYTMKVQKQSLHIKESELGREAGTIGAALLALVSVVRD